MTTQTVTGDPEIDADLDNERRKYPKANGFDSSKRLVIRQFHEINYQPGDESWLIENLLFPGETSELFGPPNCGKTFLALHFSLTIASGALCLGRKTSQAPVLYIAAEGGRRIDKRITAWKIDNLYQPNDRLPFALITEPVDLCHPPGDTQAIIEAATTLDATPGLLVIETVNAVLNGGDENSPRDMGELLASNRRLHTAFPNCHILYVHHPAKGRDNSRGHSSLPAAIDTELAATRDDENVVTTVKMTKQREGELADAFTFKLKVVELGINNGGDKITSCVVVPADPPPAAAAKGGKKPPKISDDEALALRTLDLAIARSGQTPPASNYIPSDTQAVDEALWRRFAQDGGVNRALDQPDIWNKRFNSIRNKLLRAGQIGSWQSWIWRIPA